MKSTVLRLESLSDDALLARLAEVVSRKRRTEAELVWHLAEVDRRRLYRGEACPSMHVYATSRLHLSDAEAYLRIAVARISRRFPIVLSMLAAGKLHLSAIAMLGPHLREESAEAVLARAIHRSKREIEILVAELAPRPDVPSRMRRLPAGSPPRATVEAAALFLGGVGNRDLAGSTPASAPGAATAGPAAAETMPALPAENPPAPHPTRPTAVVTPLSTARYGVHFTAGEELHDKITRAQALLRHQIPDGNLAAVFDRAMTLLLRELERARFAATSAPRKTAGQADPAPSSRRIPGPIKRAVWTRDAGQCTFRDREGRRCPARERLEFHHLTPFAQGGDHSESNLALRCSSHNAHQADLDFGADYMAARRQGLGRRRGPSGSGARCDPPTWRMSPRPPTPGEPAGLLEHGMPPPRISVLGCPR